MQPSYMMLKDVICNNINCLLHYLQFTAFVENLPFAGGELKRIIEERTIQSLRLTINDCTIFKTFYISLLEYIIRLT